MKIRPSSLTFMNTSYSRSPMTRHNTYSYLSNEVHKNLNEPKLSSPKSFYNIQMNSSPNRTINRNFSQCYQENNSKAQNLYDDLSAITTQYKTLQNINTQLIKENNYLKEVLENKQKIISEFETVVRESTIKFEQLESLTKEKQQDLYENYMEDKNSLLRQIEEMKKIIDEKNLIISEFEQKNSELHEEKSSILQQLNQLNVTNLNQSVELNQNLSELERENEQLRLEKFRLMEDNDKIRQYAFTIEDTCATQAKKRQQRENEEHQREKEYINTITQLKQILNEKETENKQLKKLLFDNSNKNKTIQASETNCSYQNHTYEVNNTY